MAKPKTVRPITIADLHTLKFVQPGAISPDSSSYIFSVRTTRQDRKGYDYNLYVVSAEGAEVRQFTYGEKSDAGPVYSPDGSLIAFVGKRGRRPGIQIIPADGGEAHALVERNGAFADLSFSPDGRKILCTFQPDDPVDSHGDSQPHNGPGKGGDEGSAEKPAKPEVPVYRHIDRLFYRLDAQGFLPKEEPQIWLFDVETGAGTQLTRGKRGAVQPVFSPDGRRIAFIANVRPDPDLERYWIDLFIIGVGGGKRRQIPTPPGPLYQPSFSPDGKTIAYLGHDDIEDPSYESPRVWVVAANGRGKARCLCPKFDQPAYDGTISDMGGEFSITRPHWSPNSRSIFFLSCSRGSSGLYRVLVRGGTPVRVTPDRIHLRSPSLSRNAGVAVGVVSTATMLPEIFAYDIRTGKGRRLTFLNRDWAAGIDIQKPKHVRIMSTENTIVDAWILKPPRFSPRKKYPAIVEVHGGPQAQYGYSFFHEMQLLAAQGYVVLYSNPRGSLGYGRAFAEAIKGDWGNRDFADVMAGTDYLERLSYVDANRIGITGGSYGGFMTNWAVGHTRRYKAAVTQRSVVDLVPFFGSSDCGFIFRLTFGGYPWENLDAYRRQSPLTYAKDIRTPLLIIHSEGDLRCNIEQAENLFATLKVLKRRVEFIRFPEEPHGLSRQGRPDRRQVRLEKIVEWFERYL